MGRKERRAKERQERKESIRMTPDRIYELKQKTANEAVRRVQEIEKGKEKQRAETALDMLLLFGMTYIHMKLREMFSQNETAYQNSEMTLVLRRP